MFEILSIGFLASAFVAGMAMFLAPCTLPLVPAYLGFISGVSHDELNDPKRRSAAKRKIILNGTFFILGFGVIFTLFGTLAGFLGSELATYRDVLSRIGGAFIILSGLFMIGVLRLPFLSRTRGLKLPKFLDVGTPTSSFAIGASFALGWTPCIGPVLGAVLVLAATKATAFSGGVLLATFSAGLAVPFLLIAFTIARASEHIGRISRYFRWVSVVGGVFLVGLGLLLLTGNFSLTIEYGFEYLDFFDYEALLQYL